MRRAHDDPAGGEQSPEQHGGGFGAGQDGLGLDAALELLMQALDGVRGADRLQLARREAGEGKQPVAGEFDMGIGIWLCANSPAPASR